MVLDPIPQSLKVHFFGSRPQPPTSRDAALYRMSNYMTKEMSHTHISDFRHDLSTVRFPSSCVYIISDFFMKSAVYVPQISSEIWDVCVSDFYAARSSQRALWSWNICEKWDVRHLRFLHEIWQYMRSHTCTYLSHTAQIWNNRTLAVHEWVHSRFLVLPGDESTITEITEYTYFSLLKPCREFKYKSE